MRLLSSLVLVVGLWFWMVPASAESVLERVKERGILYCGGVARPGLADQSGGAGWHGLEIDIGRAIAAAVLSSPDKVEFHAYATDKDFVEGAKSDDVLFLTGSEISDHHLAGLIVPGPAIFVESQGVMVAGGSDIQHLKDLKNRSICFYIGSPSENELNAYAQNTGLGVFRRPFSEVGEMVDAYAAKNCEAIAGEVTDLAAIRDEEEVRHLASRILPETLDDFPVLAATGTSDAQWSSLVAWTVYTLISGERQESPWYGGRRRCHARGRARAGSAKGWQRAVLKAVGNYGDIFRRNLGAGSPLNLDRGINVMSPFLD